MQNTAAKERAASTKNLFWPFKVHTGSVTYGETRFTEFRHFLNIGDNIFVQFPYWIVMSRLGILIGLLCLGLATFTEERSETIFFPSKNWAPDLAF